MNPARYPGPAHRLCESSPGILDSPVYLGTPGNTCLKIILDIKMKKKVLFVCVHNSARSQIAEAYLKKIASEAYDVFSAGLEPGNLNSVVVEAMKQDGIDISGNRTKSVNEFLNAGVEFDHVITVCDESSAEQCPFFPGKGNRMHWGFEDPSSLKGTFDEKLVRVKQIRDQIKSKVTGWLQKDRMAQQPIRQQSS